MKFFPKTMPVFLFLLMIAGTINSQDKQDHSPPWVSGKGYWNTESNIHDPLNHIIRQRGIFQQAT